MEGSPVQREDRRRLGRVAVIRFLAAGGAYIGGLTIGWTALTGGGFCGRWKKNGVAGRVVRMSGRTMKQLSRNKASTQRPDDRGVDDAKLFHDPAGLSLFSQRDWGKACRAGAMAGVAVSTMQERERAPRKKGPGVGTTGLKS